MFQLHLQVLISVEKNIHDFRRPLGYVKQLLSLKWSINIFFKQGFVIEIYRIEEIVLCKLK